MKKWFFLILLLLLLFNVSCFKPIVDDPIDPVDPVDPIDPIEEENKTKVQTMKDLFETLNKVIVLEDEQTINNIEKEYNEFDEELKPQIDNYQLLTSAKDKIKELKVEFIKEQAITYLDNLNTVCNLDVKKVEFEKTLRYTINGTKYLVGIAATSNNRDYLDDSLNCFHTSCDKLVKVSFYYYCQQLDFNDTKELEFCVMGYKLKDLTNKTISAGYFYGKSTLEEIDFKTLDVIKYSFGGIKVSNGEYSLNVDNTSLIEPLMKAHDYGIRVTLAIGGWQDDSTVWNAYKAMIRTTGEKRTKVIRMFIETMKQYHFDGIDMDWEYPASSDKKYYTEFMKDLKKAMTEYDPNTILSIAVGCGTGTGNYYDYANLKDCIDYFDCMSYDFTYTGDTKTVHLCNLYSGTYTASNAEVGMNYLASFGIPKSKIIMGIAFYAHIFKVTSATNNGLGQQYTTRSYTTFHDIKNNYFTNPNYTKYYDSQAHAYYLFSAKDMTFITYDDPQAVKEKCEYVLNKKYGGVMFWCHSEDSTKTLMTEIYNALKK